MEDIHGVDVSWLHHSNKDHHFKTHVTPAQQASNDTQPDASCTAEPQDQAQHGGPAVGAAPSPAKPSQPATPAKEQPKENPAPSPKPLSRRPSLLTRVSSGNSASQDPGKGISRRGSWITSLSSKFATHPQGQPSTGNSQASPAKGDQPLLNGQQRGLQEEPAEKHEPYTPQAQKTGPVGFFSNALRRLSSGSPITPARVAPHGGLCPRKVMNIDLNRPRCLVPELDQSKLRRVAFCVDVEIAGGPRYKDDGDVEKKTAPKLKERGEGEALKHPEQVAMEKEKTGMVQVSGEEIGTGQAPNSEGTLVQEPQKNQEPKKEMSAKKREKKKRSEAERKERKEKKRRKAEENGQIPMEFTYDDDSSSSPSGVSTPKTQDRPTIDPLRIYRRCCQLRESPILKRITEQLMSPSTCPAATPGVVTCLDLTGSRLQLADLNTLGDWLAVVPVKKLILEDSDLTDEGVRVVLAGLLAAKPDAQRRRPRRANPHEKVEESTGVVERLSLKNNPRITREAWKHISLFLYMCKSLKALDVSMNPFPQSTHSQRRMSQSNSTPGSPPPSRGSPPDIADIFCKALSERLGGSHFEELIMAECQLTAYDLRKLVEGITVCGLRRLSVAGNDINDEGLEHIIRYVRSGVCMGLDLGGNDLRDRLGRFSEQALLEHCPLWALSLADCNLCPDSLKPLFPKLVHLPDFRFIDLSHNHDLFSTDPSALGILRKYIPKLPMLKRLHLVDVSLSPAQAVRLAEVLPESPHLAHLNILENPQISKLASATDEAEQEDACALYASLMSAVRVSDSLICIDVDVPSPASNEIVKALAKQVVAYCLRNVERLTETEDATALLNADQAVALGDKAEAVPDVLMHLVGHIDGYPEHADDSEPAPDVDYIVGGTGVVKALSYCLSEKEKELRRPSIPASGASTPQGDSKARSAKAKNMSKNLLDSARKIRARLQPALARESRSPDDMNYRRLLFLDQTLQGMIQRFEEEYPECRIPPNRPISTFTTSSTDTSTSAPTITADATSSTPAQQAQAAGSPDSDVDPDDADGDHIPIRSRHNSDVSLASRALSLEEGRLHRLGQHIRRQLLPPETADHAHGVVHEPGPEPPHMTALRERLYSLSGEEIRRQVETEGWENILKRMGTDLEELSRIQQDDPERFESMREEWRSRLGGAVGGANLNPPHPSPPPSKAAAASGHVREEADIGGGVEMPFRGLRKEGVVDEVAVEDEED